MDKKYQGFRKIFESILCVDKEYLPTRGFRLSNTLDTLDYSSLEAMPYLKNRVVLAMSQAKKEFGFSENKKLSYFDEDRWANLITNQIYQINRVYNDDPFFSVLVKEADELMKDYYGVVGG